MKTSIQKLVLGTIVIAFFTACGGSTYMVDSWKAPGETIEKGELKKVMVSVLAKNETTRRKAEEQISGYNAAFVPSYQVLGTQEIAMDTSVSKAVLERQNFDAVLVLHLREKNTTTTWVPGNTYNYWGYHGMYYGSYYDPGYMQQDVHYVVETNLYSLKEKKLLWSGITNTVNPASIEQTISEIVTQVYQRMQKDGLFPPENQTNNP